MNNIDNTKNNNNDDYNNNKAIIIMIVIIKIIVIMIIITITITIIIIILIIIIIIIIIAIMTVKSRTVQNDPAKGNPVGNYRPISCLNLLWKLQTSIIADKLYQHPENENFLLEE